MKAKLTPRVLAMMANNQKVRELAGEEWPRHSFRLPTFSPARSDTTTDDVHLFDLEDAPSTHRADIARLREDLENTTRLTSQERCARFPMSRSTLSAHKAAAHVRQRSVDWSQVRPEWGLSGNTAFVIGPRNLTKALDLDGRVFLHSYDCHEDPSNRLLEVLLTGPQAGGANGSISRNIAFFNGGQRRMADGGKTLPQRCGRIGIIVQP